MKKIVKVNLFVKSCCFAFALMLCCFAICGLCYTPISYAYEQVSTQFTSNQYQCTLNSYTVNNVDGQEIVDTTSFSHYRAVWYVEFVVSANSVQPFLYALDTNYNSDVFGDYVDFTKEQLYVRPYTDTSTQESYFVYHNGLYSQYRYLEYVCQYEIYDTIPVDSALPDYLEITYSDLGISQWQWTIANIPAGSHNAGYYISNSYVLQTYTWGNEYYRVSLSFPVQTTRDFFVRIHGNTASQPNASVYSYTMYYNKDAMTNDSYRNGYEQGKKDGINFEKTHVDKNSASYLAGVQDTINGQNPYTFWGLMASITDSILLFCKGLLDFSFLGVNLYAVFKVLLSFGMVYGVFRLVKG